MGRAGDDLGAFDDATNGVACSAVCAFDDAFDRAGLGSAEGVECRESAAETVAYLSSKLTVERYDEEAEIGRQSAAPPGNHEEEQGALECLGYSTGEDEAEEHGLSLSDLGFHPFPARFAKAQDAFQDA